MRHNYGGLKNGIVEFTIYVNPTKSFRLTKTFGNSDVTNPFFTFESGRNIVLENNAVSGPTPLIIKIVTPAAQPVLRKNTSLVDGGN